MAKTFFIKSDSEPLIRAMWSELKQLGYITEADDYSLDALELNYNAVTNKFVDDASENNNLEDYKFLCAIDTVGGATEFTLPDDWDEALAFAKEQIESFDKPLPEYVECISSETNDFTIGKIYNFPNPIDNDGDKIPIDILNGSLWKFKPSTKEAFDAQNKAAIESLEENCYYKVVEDEFWMVGKVSVGNNGNSNENLLRGRCHYLIDSDEEFVKNRNWCYKDTNRTYQKLSPNSDEVQWLEACNKANKYIPKEEVLNPKPKFNIGDWVHLTWDNDGDEDIFQIKSILEYKFYTDPHYRNGEFLCDGVSLLMQPKRQTFRLATEKEIKEILIKEAKRRYPVGTKFNTPDSDADYAKEQVVIKPIFTITKDYSHRTIITIAKTSKNSEGICYVDGKWAEIITNKTVTFGDTQFTCYKGYAECSYGKVTKDEVKKILDYFDQDISILGYKMSIVNKGDWFVKFGCQQDKLSKIREIYNNI